MLDTIHNDLNCSQSEGKEIVMREKNEKNSNAMVETRPDLS